jgi:glyoxylase-like metal-dependent hydrolase (beta-lactamase superfamily II)
LITVVDGQRVGFTGDLIAAPGKLWSLAATQWTYNGAEGAASSLASLLDMQMRGLEVLLPSHGEPIGDPPGAIMLLTNRLEDLLRAREEYAWVRTDAVNSYRALSPHLLHNQHSNACSYVLLSQSGKALLIDFGYDFSTGLAAGSDRAARRPWLYSLDGLKRTYGVECIDVVLPTHYHDDHVAGFNLLRRVEGTQVWAAKTVADVLVDPARFNLPCLWYDPIPVDAVLPTGTPFQWEEYWLELHPLPGHTRHAVAISFVVDGRACLATGDQYQFGGPPLLNYVYQNDFAIGDYRASAALLRRLRPDVLLTGHWGEQPCPDEFIEELSRRGNELESLHLDLLAEEVQGLGAGGLPARIQPYRSRMRSGETAVFEIELINPFPFPSKVEIRPVFPTGWTGASQPICLWLGMGSGQRVTFNATAPATTCRRARLAIDLRIGEHHYGQAAEALVDVV